MAWNTKIPHLRRFVLQNFPFIEEDFDALTDYQLICKVVEYLNKVITSQNEVVDQMINVTADFEQLRELFNQLKDFVDHYFDNLDVQEEINNKLDAMAEDGTLQLIIEEYLNPTVTWTFNTVSEMVSSSVLKQGCFAKTIGKYSAEDGLGAKYKIDETGEIELDNGLYATVVKNDGGNNYYDEITFSTTRLYDTCIYITTVPPKDSDNNDIKFSVDRANKTPSQYAHDNLTSLTMNGLAYVDATHNRGSVISNGTIAQNVITTDLPDCYYYIGFMSDGSLRSFKANETSADDLITAGCEQAFMGYWRLIVNGVAEDFDTIASQILDGGDVVLKPQPRQAIGQKADGTVIIVTTDGRNPYDVGLTSSELATVMSDLECVNAWNLDGGGSTATVVRGYKINKSVDGGGTAERVRDYTINVKRQTIDKELGKAYSNAGFAVNASYNKLIQVINQAIISEIDSQDPNSLVDDQCVKLSNHTQNAPSDSASLYIINYPHPRPEFNSLYAMQIGYNRDDNRAFTRREVNGVYTEWQPIMGYYDTAYTNVNFTGTADQTYEPIPFDTSYSNITDGLTKVGNDATFTQFKVKCNADTRFEVSFTVTCSAAVTGGAKYAKIMLDNSEVTNTITATNVAQGEQGVISCTAILPYSLVNKAISLQVYGATGDLWRKCKVSLKQVN